MAGRGNRSYLIDQCLRGRGSTKWEVRVLGAEGPVFLIVGRCLSHSSPPPKISYQRQAMEGLAQSLDRLPGTVAGPMQARSAKSRRRAPPSAALPAPGPTNAQSQAHFTGICAYVHAHVHIHTHAHTHTQPHSLLSIWHTGDARGLQQRRQVAPWPQPSKALSSENTSARGNLRL